MEQMKGATVDTMALAVEGSEVVLIGVSRAYKESSNCRMEAQYALQKKKPLVPLMLTKGYEADGWLGLLLGTSMWYAFYGETLSSASSSFDKLIDGLCREIGSRGRADAIVAQIAASVGSGEETLGSMKLSALKKRAVAADVGADDLDAADDADDIKGAVIGLILAAEGVAASSADAGLRAELDGCGKLSALKERARAAGVAAEAPEGADDAEDIRAAVVELIVRAGSPRS